MPSSAHPLNNDSGYWNCQQAIEAVKENVERVEAKQDKFDHTMNNPDDGVKVKLRDHDGFIAEYRENQKELKKKINYVIIALVVAALTGPVLRAYDAFRATPTPTTSSTTSITSTTTQKP